MNRAIIIGILTAVLAFLLFIIPQVKSKIARQLNVEIINADTLLNTSPDTSIYPNITVSEMSGEDNINH